MSDYMHDDDALSSTDRGSPRDVELSIGITVKYLHNSLTGNMLGHLWTKHRIDKDYSERIDTKLRKAIDYLALMLLLEYECCDQLDDEYLKLINLTTNEWQLLDDLILLLKPFYEATTVFFGSTYSTLNLIYPTIKLLIKKFMPSDGQTKEDYTDLLFESREQTNNQSQLIDEENSDEDSDESDIDESNTYKQYKDPQFKDRHSVVSPVNTKELYYVVKVTIQVSKNDELAKSSNMSTSKPTVTSDLMADLYGNEESDEIIEESE
ncbi:19508_t:CDS:2, partial [Cetraspora pellucida]